MTGRWSHEPNYPHANTYLAFCADGKGLLVVEGEEPREFEWRALSDKAVHVRWSGDGRDEILPFRMTDRGLFIEMGSHTDSETPLGYLGKPGTLDEERERIRTAKPAPLV